MKRREFVVKTTVGAAALGLTGFGLLSASERLTKGKPLGLGIIGAGQRGTGIAKILQRQADFQVVALCDTLSFRLEKAQEVAPQAQAVADYRKLLDNPQVDAVLIATPPGLHAEIALAALAAGKHVYCEKTQSLGHGPTEELRAAANASDLVFQVGHQYHNSRLYIAAAEWIKEGGLGQLIEFQCQWNRYGDWRRNVPAPKWERQVNWRMYRDVGAGLTAELSSHHMDFCNWVVGAPVQSVLGVGGIDYWKDGRETYDNIHLITRYATGVTAKYTCLTANRYEGYQLKVKGDLGTMVVGGDEAYIFARNPDAAKEIGTVDGVSGATVKAWEKGEGVKLDVPHKEPTLQALLDFARCVQNSETPLSNVNSGSWVSHQVQMALDAMDNGTLETFDPAWV